jgi:phage repressor protein C with HTH and peptisase S24 domain
VKKKDVRDRLFKIISNFSESQMEKPPNDSDKWEQPEPTEKQESKFPEKREHIRKDASVYGIFETKHIQFRDVTKNVSVGGLLVDTETSLSFHEDIFMTLFHKNLNFPVRTNGKVVRVDSDGVGIQFNQVMPIITSI